MPLRVAGADPGTSSLDWLILEDGQVVDQCRFTPGPLQADPSLPVRWLQERGPFALIAGPSGYGLPLIPAAACTDEQLSLMTLSRPDEALPGGGVLGFRRMVLALRESGLPVAFLPGVIHLPTVPAQRKLNRIDLGTADKLCVAALALAQRTQRAAFCLVELGSAFSACLVVADGQVVDGVGGSSGPFGWRSGGAWDGEAAHWLGPLAKRDLFAGGVASASDATLGRLRFRESLLQTVAGLQALTPFREVVLSGRLLDTEPTFIDEVRADLGRLATVSSLEALPGAWVKHAAQGAALIADGLAGGRYAPLVQRLQLADSAGTVLDWLTYRK
ncbi:MAG: DUF1464 family protein [Planctomycetia bacterium]|nr:DUF1464 family protein [Planctomycetia bacterium]